MFAGVALGYGLFMFYFFMSGILTWSGSLSVAIAVIGTLLVFTLVFFGLANAYLARAVWGIRPKMTVTSFLGQGFLLVFILPFFSYGIAWLAVTGETGTVVAAALVTFILDAVVSGYMGKEVALEFVPARDGEEELASVRDRHRTCPSCGASFISRDVGDVTCPRCQSVFHVEGEGPGLDWA